MENNKSRQETVAAITVTYNRTRTLEKCIDALLNQTRPVDHIIIADNHSCEEEQEKNFLMQGDFAPLSTGST